MKTHHPNPPQKVKEIQQSSYLISTWRTILGTQIVQHKIKFPQQNLLRWILCILHSLMISTPNAAKLKSCGKCLIEWLRRSYGFGLCSTWVCQRSIGLGGKDARLRSYKPNVVTWNTLIDPTLQMKTQKLSGFRWWVFIFLKWYLKSLASHGFCRWQRWCT